jgi:hypothetical protein
VTPKVYFVAVFIRVLECGRAEPITTRGFAGLHSFGRFSDIVANAIENSAPTIYKVENNIPTFTPSSSPPPLDRLYRDP